MGETKRFANEKPDVWVMVNRKYRIWQTDYCRTDMCKAECSKIDAESKTDCYCKACRKIECTRHCNPSSTTQLWRNINSIVPRV